MYPAFVARERSEASKMISFCPVQVAEDHEGVYQNLYKSQGISFMILHSLMILESVLKAISVAIYQRLYIVGFKSQSQLPQLLNCPPTFLPLQQDTQTMSYEVSRSCFSSLEVSPPNLLLRQMPLARRPLHRALKMQRCPSLPPHIHAQRPS
jgi:hypothetical protein